MRTTATLAALAVLGSAAWLWLPTRDAPREIRASLSVAEALAAPRDGFARALTPRIFTFPVDHGPHAEYRTEWWYYTGNLASADGRRFGYQLTFFRHALTPEAQADTTSPWRARDVYLAHFAITDVGAGQFRAFEKLTRGAAGLAGAVAAPFTVWIDDWSVQMAGDAMRLRASVDDVSVLLVLRSEKPPVLHGARGLSQKSAQPGNASYYYSLSRLATEGTVTLRGSTVPVRGLSWMDREWSTSALAPEQTGWDWFAIQLEDGREVMFYRLRRADGTADPFSSGTLVGRDGSARHLGSADVDVEVLDTWRSARTGRRYPAGWRLRVAAAGLDVTVSPYLAGQELDLSVRYWEGAVHVRGVADGRPIGGTGYVELTGYGESPAGVGARARATTP